MYNVKKSPPPGGLFFCFKKILRRQSNRNQNAEKSSQSVLFTSGRILW